MQIAWTDIDGTMTSLSEPKCQRLGVMHIPIFSFIPTCCTNLHQQNYGFYKVSSLCPK